MALNGRGRSHLRRLDPETAEKAKTALVEGEQQFGKDLWKLLHANGSHPGLSDEDESRFRLLTLTGYARYLLGRI
jgi:hypothetical protein